MTYGLGVNILNAMELKKIQVKKIQWCEFYFDFIFIVYFL